MAKLRKWSAYKTLERPYTRWSKKRKKAFVKSRPGKPVVKHSMGDVKGGVKQFDYKMELISKENTSVRSNAIESARISCLKGLEAVMGRLGFHLKIKMIPHHIYRENPLSGVAGADRLSTGMKHSFGKNIGTASRSYIGKILIELYLPIKFKEIGRTQLLRASKKLPVKTRIVEEVQVPIPLTEAQLEQRKKREAFLLTQAKAKKVADDEKKKVEGASEKKEEVKKSK